MSIPLLQVDAFTICQYAGNPAGVCLLASPGDPKWMQAVAAEMNLAETAFLVERGESSFDLRWFTPTVEVRLCGHATLAAAHVLWERGVVPAGRTIEFATASGRLRAWQAPGGWIEMDFPANRFEPVEREAARWPEAEALGAALAIEVVAAASRGRDWVLLVESVAVVGRVVPDFAAVASLGDMIIVTAAIGGAARGLPPVAAGADFVSRTFVPAWGIPEDPVTGSAHCALGPFWAPRLGRDEMVGYQASARGGVVRVRVAGDRAILGGQAVTVIRGELAG
jgi:PhzF family phenazine biosynthesis protein